MKRTPTTYTNTVYSVRAIMIDGSSIDILLFQDRQSAENHAAYIRDNCRLLGYASLSVVERCVIGKPEAAKAAA